MSEMNKSVEQMNRIIAKIQSSGFGYISKDNCYQIAMIVKNELILDAVFEPLPERTPQPATSTPAVDEIAATCAGRIRSAYIGESTPVELEWLTELIKSAISTATEAMGREVKHLKQELLLASFPTTVDAVEREEWRQERERLIEANAILKQAVTTNTISRQDAQAQVVAKDAALKQSLDDIKRLKSGNGDAVDQLFSKYITRLEQALSPTSHLPLVKEVEELRKWKEQVTHNAINLIDCGACAEILFTGGTSGHQHTCGKKQPEVTITAISTSKQEGDV